ncbi:MAG: MBL fold metallo-hydrolase [Candidatus Marinimicrobia bacterium]|nr:MBL fold metallo-hydrolase [Candidatus Neomarinimicrobiota bacterium]MBL7031259.1 MBL fold metallo-hydrolase [Candidatus Neomarinimicrobiota bacterium]
MKKIALYSFIGVLGFIVVLLTVLLNYRPQVPQLEKYRIDSSLPHSGNGMVVQFTGNTNILITDGQTSILTDGFFTRPGVAKVLWGEVEPDETVIKYCLEQAGIQKLDAVIPVHSHFDHAMDSPMVAELTGAKLIGSGSTANIGRGLDFPENQMVIPNPGETIQLGAFKISLVKGRHWPYPNPEMRAKLLDREIINPVKPPVSVFEYYEGDSYTIIIEHPEATLAVHGSAGFIPNILDNFDVDILFLGMAGLETMDDEYNNNYQTHVVEALNPDVIVPIHWDDFFVPLEDGIKSRSLLEKVLQGMDVKKAFEMVEERNPNRKMVVLPLWERVNVAAIRRLD